jgi:methionyl-tRNA formyltransferase
MNRPSKKHRLIFMGTPDFADAHLDRFLSDPVAQKLYEIVQVVTQPDRPAGRKLQLQPSPVKARALQHGISVLTPESAKDEAFIDQLRRLQADAVLVVAYGQILSAKFLTQWPHRVLNVHASLLPRWRGAAPIQRAVMAGDSVTGVSLQVMVEALDAGDVVSETNTSIGADENALHLHDRLKVLGADLAVRDVSRFLKGELQPLAQDPSQVTLAKKILKSEAFVNWALPAAEVFNGHRGRALGPGSRSAINGLPVRLIRLRLIPLHGVMSEDRPAPGSVIAVDASAITVACGTGAVQILEIQPESRSRMTTADFLRGHSVKVGDLFQVVTSPH